MSDEDEFRAIAFAHLPPELRSENESIFLEVDGEELAAVRLLACDLDHRLVERYRRGELVSTRIVPV